MPIFRSSATFGDTVSALKDLNVTGNSSLGQDGTKSNLMNSRRDSAGPRGDAYKDAMRTRDITTDAFYSQPNNPVYDVYEIGDPATSTIFRCGIGSNLVDHLFFVVNFSSSPVPLQSGAGDPLGSLPAGYSAVMLNGSVLLAGPNQLSLLPP